MNGWNITAPYLDDDERAQAAAPGGLSDGADPGDTARALLLGLQRLSHVYPGTVAHDVVAARRSKNKAARKARRVTRRSK